MTAKGERKAHYRGSYLRRAKALRAWANANPDTVCRRCGQKAREGDPWQAGHVIDGDPWSPLAPEHQSCNARAGARLKEPRSRNWLAGP
jgi:hypothetical protein